MRGIYLSRLLTAAVRSVKSAVPSIKIITATACACAGTAAATTTFQGLPTNYSWQHTTNTGRVCLEVLRLAWPGVAAREYVACARVSAALCKGNGQITLHLSSVTPLCSVS